MNIFISNLGYRVTEESLNATFATHGTVCSTTLVTDAHTGHAEGTAIVVMRDATERAAAIQRIDGSIIDGRMIRAIEAVGSEELPRWHPAAQQPAR
jgi:RNA recognition motif-containing protein